VIAGNGAQKESTAARLSLQLLPAWLTRHVDAANASFYQPYTYSAALLTA
jgi:hypothetical protein